MFSKLDKKLVNEINEFLTHGSWPKSWTSKGRYADIAYGIVNNYDNVNSNYDGVEILKIGFSLLPPYDNEIDSWRDHELNKLYKFGNGICDYDSFRIGKLDLSNLNDGHEGKWMEYFIAKLTAFSTSSVPTIEFLKMVDKYNPLTTYTTTTLTNHNYMISNYSRLTKTACVYNGQEILSNYDSLFSGKIKPIRGFVRYNPTGKIDLFDFINKLYVKNPKLDFGLLLSIAATFIKGDCMKYEAEYRFLTLTTNKIDAIELKCVKKECCKFICELHDENPFYTGADDHIACDGGTCKVTNYICPMCKF